MRYIRTDDGIYEYVDYDNECIIPMPIIKYKGRLTHCAECDIIKQADTIEELCDEFVYEIDDNGFYNGHICCPPCKFKEFVKNIEIVDISGVYKITNKYGAIWTDKGLIYVAKMNEKGELCLL